MRKKNPTRLTNRTRLNPDQLELVVGASGGGLSTRYDSTGKQSIELTRRLQKAKKKAKKYVLYTDQLGRRMYVGDLNKIHSLKDAQPITFNRGEALEFFHGFDDPNRKLKYYNEVFYTPELKIIWQTTNF